MLLFRSMLLLRLNLRLVETSCGDACLLYDMEDSSLWLGSDKITAIPHDAEWMGFGSGDFVDGATANDVLSDPLGRWFRYAVEGNLADLKMVFEHDRKLPEEVRKLPLWNKALWD